jgi:hypothetical protein
MRISTFALVTGLALVLLAAGCNRTASSSNVDTAPLVTALKTYYQSHPSCAFSEPVTFPVDASADANIDPSELKQLDALADAGLVSKKSHQVWSAPQGPTKIRIHETVSDFELTDAGKAAWTANSGGGGNFCYGAPHVVSVDHASAEVENQRYGVSFHFAVGNLPGWTGNAKVQAAFPNIAADAAGKPQTGLATLTKTANGWHAGGVQAINSAPMS